MSVRSACGHAMMSSRINGLTAKHRQGCRAAAIALQIQRYAVSAILAVETGVWCQQPAGIQMPDLPA